MHPPFYFVDHKIGPDIHHHGETKPVIRRSRPQKLSLRPSTTGWPPVPLAPGAFIDNGALQLRSGATLAQQPILQVVPPPQRTLRIVIGRLLIRTGQRLIMQ